MNLKKIGYRGFVQVCLAFLFCFVGIGVYNEVEYFSWFHLILLIGMYVFLIANYESKVERVKRIAGKSECPIKIWR